MKFSSFVHRPIDQTSSPISASTFFSTFLLLHLEYLTRVCVGRVVVQKAFVGSETEAFRRLAMLEEPAGRKDSRRRG